MRGANSVFPRGRDIGQATCLASLNVKIQPGALRLDARVDVDLV